MGVFGFFKKRKSELSREQKKWNKMWDLWAENRADTPYAEVMTYQSEVNNGGHDQYFLNVEQTGDLQAEISILENVLSEELRSNLLTAYDAYQMLADKESDEEWEAILERCDDVFFKNEEEINRILKLSCSFSFLRVGSGNDGEVRGSCKTRKSGLEGFR